MKVGEDLHPGAEFLSLLPGGGVILLNLGINTLGYFLLYCIEVKLHLELYGIWGSSQCFGCGKVDHKWDIKAVSDRCTSQEAESSIFLSLT